MPRDKKTKNVSSVHLLEWNEAPKDWLNESVDKEFDLLLRLRPHVMKALEEKRREEMIGSGLEAKIVFQTASDRDYAYLTGFGEGLADMFVVSQATVERVEKVEAPINTEFSATQVSVIKAEGKKCERSWKYSLDVGADPEFPSLSLRSAKIVKELMHAKEKSS